MSRKLRFTAEDAANTILTMSLPFESSGDNFESSDNEEKFVANPLALENPID